MQSHKHSASCSKAVSYHITVIVLSVSQLSHNQYLHLLSVSQIVSWSLETYHQSHLPVLLSTSVSSCSPIIIDIYTCIPQALCPAPRSPHPTCQLYPNLWGHRHCPHCHLRSFSPSSGPRYDRSLTLALLSDPF